MILSTTLCSEPLSNAIIDWVAYIILFIIGTLLLVEILNTFIGVSFRYSKRISADGAVIRTFTIKNA